MNTWLRQVLLKDRVSIAEQARVCFGAVLGATGLAAVLTALLFLVIPARLLAALVVVLDLLVIVADGILIRFTQLTLRDAAFKPLDELAGAARQLGGGDLGAVPEPHGALEMRQIGSTLGILAHALQAERQSRAADRRAGDAESESLREVLRLTRNVGSHLDQDPILEELGSAARQIGGYSHCIVWRYDDVSGQLVQAYPRAAEQSATSMPRISVTDSPVGRAATSGQTVRLREEAGRSPGLAIPLTVGGVDLRILGVVELRGEGAAEMLMANPIDALEALASHAATALSAAQMHEQLEARSETDALTKILNRRKLDADLKAEAARSLRYGHPLSLIMVDVDHFKSVNDTFGHQTGDEVLKCVAATIAKGRETDAAYRFGGEEFAILLRETDATSGRAVAERMRIKIREEAAKLGLPRDITASLGVAAISPKIQSVDELIKAADSALYEAKETGRNKVVVNQMSLHPEEGTAPVAS